MASLTSGETTWTYTYNADGLRTKRTDGTNTYEYVYYNGLLQYMEYNNTPVYFTHAPDGTPMGMLTGGKAYFYITNLQGDVVGIVDATGNLVVSYTYDAWGNPVSTTLASNSTYASTVAALNPLRYRGYVYDSETGLYYLQSRYYNPTIGRFLNADGYTSTGQGFVGDNMFAYCGNNPVCRADYSGDIWWWLLESGDMGFIHRQVQSHIRKNNANIVTEVTLHNDAGDIRRADIVDSKNNVVWEVKHAGAFPVIRAIAAGLQALSYVGFKQVNSGEIIQGVGQANAFNSHFMIEAPDGIYQVNYYTPYAGVVLYSVSKVKDNKEKIFASIPVAKQKDAKEQLKVKIGQAARTKVMPDYAAIRTPGFSLAGFGGVCAGLNLRKEFCR